MNTAVERIKKMMEKVFLAVVSVILGMPIVLDCNESITIWKPVGRALYKNTCNLVECSIFDNRDIRKGRAE